MDTLSLISPSNGKQGAAFDFSDFHDRHGKTVSSFFASNPAFSQAYVFRVRTSFSPVETGFTALSFRSFRNKFIFRYMPLQKAITNYKPDLYIIPFRINSLLKKIESLKL